MTLAQQVRLWPPALIATGALLAWAALAPGAPRWLPWLLALATPLLFTALLVGIEMAVAAWVDPRVPRRPPLAVLKAWLHETWTSLLVFGWRQAWRSAFDELPLTPDPARPAVLLVHGYVCNRALWQPLLKSGALDGCNVATVNLEPVFGSIDAYAEVIDRAVRQLQQASNAAQVMLVCHSMGGLAARAYLRRHGDAAVARVITLASPHAGTVLGGLGLGRNARQMARNSAWLHELAAAESDALRRKFVCVAALDDAMVVPRASALLPGAVHEVVDDVGHLALLDDPRCWALIGRYMQERLGSGAADDLSPPRPSP
jgi:pimeloyl-ACP methyl ester carboxylesterase